MYCLRQLSRFQSFHLIDRNSIAGCGYLCLYNNFFAIECASNVYITFSICILFERCEKCKWFVLISRVSVSWTPGGLCQYLKYVKTPHKQFRFQRTKYARNIFELYTVKSSEYWICIVAYLISKIDDILISIQRLNRIWTDFIFICVLIWFSQLSPNTEQFFLIKTKRKFTIDCIFLCRRVFIFATYFTELLFMSHIL